MTEPTPRYYCPDCPTPVGNCQCNWEQRAIERQNKKLETLAQQAPQVSSSQFHQWLDTVLGQSYAHLKRMQNDNFDDDCISHLGDVVHYLGELKERYSEIIPF